MTSTEQLEYLENYLTPRRKMLFDQVLNQRTNFINLATQDVYQLHNTSAVIRSCDVFGIQNIHVVEERFPKRIDKEIAMGAQKWVDVNRYSHIDNCIKSLREKDFEIVATSPHGEAVELPDFELHKPAAIFFGTEKEGLSKEVLENADRTLKIPMVGFTESLNISVSAAIILQTLTSKLRKSDLPWQLSEEEKLELKLKWAKKSIKDSAKLLERKFGLNP
jgi:tRNA (guanosine-2'-O-)-methyltransferase